MCTPFMNTSDDGLLMHSSLIRTKVQNSESHSHYFVRTLT